MAREFAMKRKRFSVEQIAAVLKQVEAGLPVADLIRQVGISEQTYYRWKKQYAGLQSDQVRELKLLQDENARLKNRVGYTVDLLVGISCLTMLLPVRAQGLDRSVTPDLLQSRLAAAQSASELDEARKTRLVDIYRQSIGNLEAARGNRDATEEYRRALSSAPEEAAKFRAKIERRKARVTELRRDRMQMPMTRGKPDKHTRRQLRDRNRGSD
jgi:putative transposase